MYGSFYGRRKEKKKRAFKVKLRTREMDKIEKSRFIDQKILNSKNMNICGLSSLRLKKKGDNFMTRLRSDIRYVCTYRT